MAIKLAFGNMINGNLFTAVLFEGIQLLSAIGTAVAYIIYLIRALFKDAKHVLSELRAKDDQEKE